MAIAIRGYEVIYEKLIRTDMNLNIRVRTNEKHTSKEIKNEIMEMRRNIEFVSIVIMKFQKVRN